MVAMMRRELDPFRMLRTAMDRLMEEAPFIAQRATFPALNVWEDSEHLYVEAELPGLTAENIEASVVGRELTIKGRRSMELPENVTLHRRERGTGEFTRTLTLPIDVDAQQVRGALHDGVFTITLPKSPAAKSRKITVQPA
jgi:HSP20 family protein